MNIRMEPEQVREVAEKLDYLNDSFSTSFNNLSSMINKTPWQGADRDAFFNDFKSLHQKADDLIAAGHQLARSVHHEVEEWESVDRAGKSRIKSDYKNFPRVQEPTVDRFAQLKMIYTFIENLIDVDIQLHKAFIELLTSKEVMKVLLDTGLNVVGAFCKGPFIPFTPGFEIDPTFVIVKPDAFGFLIGEGNQLYYLNAKGKTLVA